MDERGTSSLIRWGGLAAVLGGVLFMAVDGATTGASAVRQTLLLLGTMLLLGGLVVFLAAFFGPGLFVRLAR